MAGKAGKGDTMNKNIEDMRTALKTYKNAKQGMDKRLEDIQARYGDEALKREHERLISGLKTAKETAKNTIENAYLAGMVAVDEWAKLDGGKLTDDAKLLDAGLVDPENFDRLVDRYQDNATMLYALRYYGMRQNAAAMDQGSDQRYNVDRIVTASGRKDNWNKAKKTALDLLDAVDGTGRYEDSWNKAIGEAMSDQAIDSFGTGEAY